MTLYQKYNNENILTRALIGGLLNILNNQIKYTQIWGNESDETETILVPWYYNSAGDERFNQDFYTFYRECLSPRHMDSYAAQIPRGVITYTGSTVDEQRITSRFIQGRYIKEVNNQLETYVSYLYSIPLNIRIDCEMWIDRQITALKIEQEIREVFYRTVTYYVYYKGLRIGSTVGFPADVTIEKNINYSFESDNKIKLNFQLEIETYQPVFDPTAEMKATSKIKGFGYSLYPGNQKNTENSIQVTSPSEGAIIPKGIPIWIEWIFNNRGRIINSVNITWFNEGENESNDIELKVPNHGYYIWNIPDDFTSFKEPVIIWEEDASTTVIRAPNLRVIPNLSTKQITASSFLIVDEGYFGTLGDDVSMNIQLEMKDDNGNISYTGDGDLWANIKWNKLDLTTPITINPDTSVWFPGTVDFSKINIHVSDFNNNDTLGIMHNIRIV